MRILYIGPKTGSGTGGEAIRIRNQQLLKGCCGEENFRYFYLPWFVFYPFPRKYYARGGKGLREYAKRLRRNVKYGILLRRTLRAFAPDVIFLDHSMIRLPSVRMYRRYKVIAFFHNIETEYARQEGRSAETQRQIADAEKLICENAKGCICLNERDSALLQRICGRSADLLLPTTFTDSYRDIAESGKGEYLLFVGSDFYGNTDGLFRFIETALDRIPMRLLIVGSGMQRYRGKYPDHKVDFLGYVPSLVPYYEHASCVVLPIISGSGMKTKTCEALMYGKRIFGTDEAFEGYGEVERAECVRCSSADDFVTAINEYLQRDIPSFSPAARRYFSENFSTDTLRERFCAFMEQL